MRINFSKILKRYFSPAGEILILLLLPSFSLLGSESLIEIKAEVDRSIITIGDRVTYSLTIEHAKNLHIEQPGPGANLGHFEIKDYKIHDPLKRNGSVQQRFDYQISVFDTGKFVIPPFPVAFAESDTSRDYQIILSEPIEIFVNSVLTAEDNEIRDIKPPQEVPINYRKWVLGGGVALLILLLGAVIFYFVVFRKKGISLFQKETIRPAHEIALEELALIRQQWRNLLSRREHKQLFTWISQTFRQYLENRFYINALEETTFEIDRSLQELKLGKELQQLALTLLGFSDLVKFAKYLPVENEVEKCLGETETFIQKTKLLLQTEQPAQPMNGGIGEESLVVQMSEQTEQKSA